MSRAGKRKKDHISGRMKSGPNRLRSGINADVSYLGEIGIVNKGAAVGRDGKQRSISTGCALVVVPTRAAAFGDRPRSYIIPFERSTGVVALGDDNSGAIAA